MPPNISLRESIRWLPDEAYEDTNTVVLTSGEQRFVDVRLRKTDEGTRGQDPEIDWAFAGTATSTQASPDTDNTHTTWYHWIDSRHHGKAAEGILDHGDMSPLPGDRTLEKGRMINPATGKETDYEEIWKDEEPIAVPSNDEPARRCCIVLTLEDTAAHVQGSRPRGMLIRVGHIVQGMVKTGETTHIERWQWEKSALQGSWVRTCKVGIYPLPVLLLTSESALKGSAQEDGMGHPWKVVESEYF
ncbi:hypothetical protein BAUCODRAFT_263048 [Baudoinia panamericana UAMH 10762]|uniref:Protein HRI1 n=1 Tax=Baudoinia panamericana (strain UAMH 10762) TaxID=717646 RepID=M2N2A8_BAUPA|nr:uncharacterized protein BAUCODRAFT_263048 [Baudoinia panamericana UAMH 10762]EMC92810.1 hypothetical protein BAUCODRAFT_263048 [Baudoinia panamericana UAMH 10762]